MSYYCYSFDIKKITSIKEYLFILKNCLRLCAKNNLYKNAFNKRIHVRYCDLQKKYYYCINSSRTKNYFGNENCIMTKFNINKVLNVLKLNKYNNRCIEFDLDKEDNLFPIALYNFESKNIILAYSNLFSYFEKHYNTKILSSNLQIQIKDYQKLFDKYINYIKKNIFLEESIENYLDLKLKSSDIRMSYCNFDKIYKKKEKPCKKNLFFYVVFFLSIEFNRFLNVEYCLKDKDLCLYDKNLNKIIKLPFSFYDKKYNDIERELFSPLLPVSF